jgi:hypothetical protein
MSSIIISNSAPFGALTNQTIADLHTVSEAMERLQAAVASASSGYTGTPGTEFEGPNNNFGVTPSATPGEQGAAYSFALDTLAADWNTFWTSAKPSIDALDNGVRMP